MVLKEIRISFNKKLAEARATKVSHISKIAEMKVRIIDLHKMLSMQGDYTWPDLNEVIDVSLTIPSHHMMHLNCIFKNSIKLQYNTS